MGDPTTDEMRANLALQLGQIFRAWAAKLRGLDIKAVIGEMDATAVVNELRWATDVEPGTPIVDVDCPCCGAALEVTHGSDEGEVSVHGTSPAKPGEDGADSAQAMIRGAAAEERGRVGAWVARQCEDQRIRNSQLRGTVQEGVGCGALLAFEHVSKGIERGDHCHRALLDDKGAGDGQ